MSRPLPFFFLLAFIELKAGNPSFFTDDLTILDESHQLWKTYGEKIWPDFDPEKLPVLLYYSAQKQLLINYPITTELFQTADSYPAIPHPDYSIRRCQKSFWPYHSATVWPINNVWTTILPARESWSNYCQEKNIPFELFNPETLVLITIHERFHTFQMNWLADSFRDIFDLSDNSSPKTQQTRLSDIQEGSELAERCMREQNVLFKAVTANLKDSCLFYIQQFVEVRHDYKKMQEKDEAILESFLELMEGSAKYLEYKLKSSISLDYRAMNAVQALSGFKQYQKEINNYSFDLTRLKQGVLTSERVYVTGLAICLLLDRIAGEDWKKDVFLEYSDNKQNIFDLLGSFCNRESAKNK